MNIAYTMITDGWTIEMRKEFDVALATAEDKAKANAEEQDASARRTATFLGGNVDSMIERAWNARQKALSQVNADQVAKMSQPLVDWDAIGKREPMMTEAK